MALNIYLDQASLDMARYALEDIKGGMPRAASRALNETFTGVRTDLVRLIRDEYNHKATAIRARITIVRATTANLTGMVYSKGRAMHLTDVTGTNQTKKGVSVNVKKSTGRQLIAHAFIASGTKSGKPIVFWRAKRGGRMVARYPIKAINAPHPEIIYNTPENWGKIQLQARERLDKNFAHEIDAIFKGYAR